MTPAHGATARRLLATASLVVGMVTVAIVGTASPADAHTRMGDATNVDSRIVATPDLPGVTWRLYDAGLWLEVTVTGDTEVVVLGYDDEPYLRVGPDGAFQNRNSPATYLNRDRYGDVAVPPRADATADPDWERVATRPVVAWQDHRTHWMERDAPAVGSPNQELVLGVWSVPVMHGDQVHHLTGELWWVPSPAPWPAILISLLVLAPAAILVGRARRQATPGAEPTAMVRPAAATVLGLAVANLLVHVPDEFLARPAEPLDIYVGVFHTLLFVGAGIGGAVWAWRGWPWSLPALAIGSVGVLFHQGLLHLPALSLSQVPTAWPTGVLRPLVAASILQVLLVAFVLDRARRDARPDASGSAVDAGDERLAAR